MYLPARILSSTEKGQELNRISSTSFTPADSASLSSSLTPRRLTAKQRGGKQLQAGVEVSSTALARDARGHGGIVRRGR
eukprot:757923-Hanusia_phi.AAC.2